MHHILISIRVALCMQAEIPIIFAIDSMHMKTHCFQRISSKEDVLSLNPLTFSAQSLLVLNSVCPMTGVCTVKD